MTQRNGRKRALIGFTALALLALTALAPAASAQVQVPIVDAPVDLPGGGGDSGGSSGGSSGGGSLGDTVGGVTDTTTDTVSNVGSGTTDAVGQVGNGVTGGGDGGGNEGGEDGGLIGGLKKTVENVTRDPGDTVKNATDDPVKTVGGLGGGVTNPLLNAESPLKADRNKDGKLSPKERARLGSGGGTTKREAAALDAIALEQRRRALADAKFASLANAEKKSRENVPAPQVAAPPQRETFITQLADAAEEAVEKLAFPLGLALMVGAFLMVQGRIDRKDAKLALAPIDSEQDLLSFQ
ncbi:MAG TPA: hypothetical protein VJ927_11615 [Actinomycetota bacterium]|nr:hypothetical protein [Actinomycetota bacterium]